MITYDMSYDEYHDRLGIRSSRLKRARTSMLHYREGSGGSNTSSRDVLKAIHCLVLEPHLFATEYAMYDGKRDPRVILYQGWLACNPGVAALKADEMERVQRTADAILRHPVAGPLLSGPGRSEVTITWQDGPSGLDCKARVDRLAGSPRADQTIVDLKGYGTPSPRETGRTAHRLGADLQAAHYRAGVYAETGWLARCMLVVYETTAPYDVAVYEIATSDLDRAAAERSLLLAQIASCEASGVWPGCASELEQLALPHYGGDEDVVVSDEVPSW